MAMIKIIGAPDDKEENKKRIGKVALFHRGKDEKELKSTPV